MLSALCSGVSCTFLKAVAAEGPMQGRLQRVHVNWGGGGGMARPQGWTQTVVQYCQHVNKSKTSQSGWQQPKDNKWRQGQLCTCQYCDSPTGERQLWLGQVHLFPGFL